MIRKIKCLFRHYRKLFRRKIKQRIFQFLVAIYDGEIRFSLFYFVCTIFLMFLCIGFFFNTDFKKETTTTDSVLGSELTHALRHNATPNQRTDNTVDITLFLLPDVEDKEAFAAFLNSPLYGFYLTGKEVSYLPELYSSLADSFAYGTPYIGGLSFSYNPKRLIYNRATDIFLYTKERTYNILSDDALYYVIGTESVFSMFHHLSERTFHLLNIQPKDAQGAPISEYSDRMLLGANGVQTVADVYRMYLSQDISTSIVSQATEIVLCKSLNTAILFSQLNSAGYFLIGCLLLFVALAAIVRPHLHRVIIWFRIFLFRRKKRAKFSLRTRIYTARIAKRRVA